MRGMKEGIAAGLTTTTLLLGGCTAAATTPIEDTTIVDCYQNETNAEPTYIPGTPGYSRFSDPNVLSDFQRDHTKPGQLYGFGTLLCNFTVRGSGFSTGRENRVVLTKVAMDVVKQMQQQG